MTESPTRRERDLADRKLGRLLAGDYLLYEITADRQMRVLHLPRRVTPAAGCGGRAFPTGGGAGNGAR